MNTLFQFPHPGGEPPVKQNADGIFPANYSGTHFRKFIHAQNGSYVISNTNQDIKNWERQSDASFTFWGEWEQASHVSFPDNFRQYSSAGFPFQLHTPIIPPADSATDNVVTALCGTKPSRCNKPDCVMSTDPFVFCEPMLYYHCKTERFTSLKNLQRGDIVVFGSKLAGSFVVDSVFVVHERVSVHDSSLCGLFAQVNGAYFSKDKDVYRGATFANPVDGMLSFFPALPCDVDGTPRPFQRPKINLRGMINHNLGRGLKKTETQNAKKEWLQIVSEIAERKLVLGLHA